MVVISTVGCTGGEGGDYPLLSFFFPLFEDQLLLVHVVFSGCLFILETHFGNGWKESVAMVMR